MPRPPRPRRHKAEVIDGHRLDAMVDFVHDRTCPNRKPHDEWTCRVFRILYRDVTWHALVHLDNHPGDAAGAREILHDGLCPSQCTGDTRTIHARVFIANVAAMRRFRINEVPVAPATRRPMISAAVSPNSPLVRVAPRPARAERLNHKNPGAAVRRVRAIMAANGWTIEDVSLASPISADTIRGFLTGRRWPKIMSQNRLEDAVGLPRGEIARLAHVPEPEPSGDEPLTPAAAAVAPSTPMVIA